MLNDDINETLFLHLSQHIIQYSVIFSNGMEDKHFLNENEKIKSVIKTSHRN